MNIEEHLEKISKEGRPLDDPEWSRLRRELLKTPKQRCWKCGKYASGLPLIKVEQSYTMHGHRHSEILWVRVHKSCSVDFNDSNFQYKQMLIDEMDQMLFELGMESILETE